MRLVMHVGHPKCASTTIQSLLWNNRHGLADRGIHLLGAEVNLPHEAGEWHWPLWALNQDSDFAKRLIGRIPEFERMGVRTLVLSAENLAQPERLQNLEPTFAAFDTCAFYYVRRQDDFLLSSWRQWGMKRGISLPQHILRRIGEGKPEFLAVARHLRQIFGEDGVHLGVLDEAFLNGGTVEADLWGALGLEGVPAIPADRANPSPDRASLLFLSEHPELFASEHDDRVVQELLAADTEPARRLRLDRHMQVSLKMIYDEANKALVAEFLNRPDGQDIIKLDGPKGITSLSLRDDDIARLRKLLPHVQTTALRQALMERCR